MKSPKLRVENVRLWVEDNLEESRHALAAIDRNLNTFDNRTLDEMQECMRKLVSLSQKKRGS